jgi:enoyl-CoA hydratase/carnithine racemase
MSTATPDADAATAATAVASSLPLTVDQQGGVCILTLNRPAQYNALSSALLSALNAELDRLSALGSLRVVVITGAGKAFCAGHDLKEMKAMSGTSPAFVREMFSACSAMMQKIAALPVPVIAEVNGMATAAGCQLVAQCDLAVSSSAAKFAVSGINLGLFCSTPAVPLTRTISQKRAAEMLMTGEFIDANTALSWGLVNSVAAPENVRASTMALVDALLAKPKAALASGKAFLNRQRDLPLSAAYTEATNNITCDFTSHDADEGIRAFIEKRPPAFRH